MIKFYFVELVKPNKCSELFLPSANHSNSNVKSLANDIGH